MTEILRRPDEPAPIEGKLLMSTKRTPDEIARQREEDEAVSELLPRGAEAYRRFVLDIVQGNKDFPSDSASAASAMAEFGAEQGDHWVDELMKGYHGPKLAA